MPAFMAEGGMPYWIDLMTSDVRKSSHFYGELLGWDFEELYVGYRVARVQGLPVAAIVDKPEDSPLPDTWVTYFLADDIEALVQRVKDLGGRVLAEPTDVNLGRMALLVDTSGGLFGAIEPYSEEAFIAAGEPGTPVWHELTCTNHYEEAAKFYRDLFDWVTRSTEAGGFRYTTALVDGAAVVVERNVNSPETDWPECFIPTTQKLKKRTYGIARMDMAVYHADLAGEED